YALGRGIEGCPDERALRNAVAARLGYDPFRDDAPRVVTATIALDGRTLRGRVRIDDGGAARGSREMTARPGECADLASALPLAVSIAIDPLSLSRGAPPAPAAAGRTDTAPPRAPEPAPPRTPEPVPTCLAPAPRTTALAVRAPVGPSDRVSFYAS